MKIKYKLILGFVSVALLVAAVGYISVTASQESLQETIGRSSAVQAQGILDKIDRSIYYRIERWKSYIFANPILTETIAKSNQEFERLDDIQNYINEKEKEWGAAPEETITPFMKELIENELSQHIKRRSDSYKSEDGYEIFPEIFVTNKYGVNVAQTGKTTDYYQADEEWWQDAKKDGLYVTDVEYDSSADVYSTDICIRIDDENGDFLGAMKVILNIEELVNIIKEVEASAKYKTTQFKLLTKDGRLIYSTEDFEVFEGMSDKLLSRFHSKEHLNYFVAEGDKPGGGDELFVHAHSKGYRDFQGFGWILVIEYETEEIFAPVVQLRNHIAIISLAVATLAVLMGLIISRAISNPLTELRNATIEFGMGNLDAQIEIKSNDEIGGLAASFNDMACKLEESRVQLMRSHIQLEEKVEERTAELSSVNTELEGEVEQRSSAQNILEERIKELKCLFSFSKLVEQPKISLEQIFQETVYLIRSAYQYPDITCARITFNGCKYETDNFKKTELSQQAPINVAGEKAGGVEVYYLGESAETDKGPFLQEERELIDAIAEHLGRVAERKKTGEKLQLFRNLIDQSNDSVFAMEPEWGRFLDINDRACDCLGYTREELFQMSVKDIDETIPDDSAWTQHVKEIRKEGHMVLEGRHNRKDGTTFPVEVNVKLINQGKEEFIIAVSRDITERKRAEEEIEKLAKFPSEDPNPVLRVAKDGSIIYANNGSEPLLNFWGCQVGESLPDEWRRFTEDVFRIGSSRNTELQCNTLTFSMTFAPVVDFGYVNLYALDITERKHAEKMQAHLFVEVEQANRELKDFAYIVSHDLKAPLRGIKTLADWMVTDYADMLDDEGKERMGLLLNRVSRMHNLIDGVLQYSRVGRVKEKHIKVNFNELVPEVIDTIVPPENIEITVEDKLPVVEFEETRIIQVFQNLLSNAVKYMDKPKGRITIGCVQEYGFWKFNVTDNGPGIEERYFEKIFQIFQTLSPRDEVESTGVGLSVVKKIVEMYGGKIWVESKPGEGSTFFFTLPGQESEVVDDAKLEANIVS